MIRLARLTLKEGQTTFVPDVSWLLDRGRTTTTLVKKEEGRKWSGAFTDYFNGIETGKQDALGEMMSQACSGPGNRGSKPSGCSTVIFAYQVTIGGAARSLLATEYFVQEYCSSANEPPYHMISSYYHVDHNCIHVTHDPARSTFMMKRC